MELAFYRNVFPMRGKVVLLTGGTQGIGKETARELARLGANVVLVARSRERGEAAVAEIQASTGNLAVELLVADLSSLMEVRRLAQEFSAGHEHLHVLVNNAGMVPPAQRTLTSEGIEVSLAVNYLAPFLLSNLLLDRLRSSAPSRIVNVASAIQNVKADDFNDLNAERGYSWQRRYALEKLGVLLFTYELARRMANTGVTVNALHPGVVNTQVSRQFGGRFKPLVKLIGRFLLTPQQGAITSVYLASSLDVEEVSGKYFVEAREARSAQLSYDEALAQRLWEASEQLTGLQPVHNISSEK